MRRPAFTLVELLVVLVIVVLVSAATLPAVISAVSHRQVSESARILQAAIEGARDAAIRANDPRGIRLMPDPSVPAPRLAFNRIVPIEPAPDYTEGRVSIRGGLIPDFAGGNALRIEESQSTGGLPNARTSWYWNVRVGDRVRVGEAGRLYTVVGPEVEANAERFANVGPPGTVPANPNEAGSEYLFLVNGQDDDGDGYTDEGFDGHDNDGDGATDELDEWEREAWVGTQAAGTAANETYTLKRRPAPTQGARVIEMPSNVVIDATTWDSTRERSRLPVDRDTRQVEVMVSPDGTAIASTLYSSPTSMPVVPFLHFWLAERGDVLDPVTLAGVPYRLPMAEGAANYPAAADTTPRPLEGDRRIVTLNTRTGNVTTGPVESFDGSDVNAPYYDARRGIRGSD
jgi:prepilin-type N-terminal cleavage/methylation domain-containing protein